MQTTTNMTATDGAEVAVNVPYIIRVYADYVRQQEANGHKTLSLDDFIAAGLGNGK